MDVKVADEVWLTLALLHSEQPDRADFSTAEILARAEREAMGPGGVLRPGVRTHLTQHCVASCSPNPGRYRMLTSTARGRRRIFLPGDPCHHGRVNGKQMPSKAETPSRYHRLLDWYRARMGQQCEQADPLLELLGTGRETWRNESPDDYVERLRAGWGEHSEDAGL